MTEEEVIKRMENESGLSFEKGEFGFITERASPFGIYREIQSASNTGDYEIWMRKQDSEMNSVYRRLHLQATVEQSWDIIIPFLNSGTEEFHKLLEGK